MGKGRGWRRLSFGLALTLLLCGSALAWETPPEQMRGLGKIVLRVKKAFLPDGSALRLTEEAAGPAAEAAMPGYIGYTPVVREGTMPQKD